MSGSFDEKRGVVLVLPTSVAWKSGGLDSNNSLHLLFRPFLAAEVFPSCGSLTGVGWGRSDDEFVKRFCWNQPLVLYSKNINSVSNAWGNRLDYIYHNEKLTIHISSRRDIFGASTFSESIHQFLGVDIYLHINVYRIHSTYCWWKKHCTTWDVQNPVNNWTNYQPQPVITGFLPSATVSEGFLWKWHGKVP